MYAKLTIPERLKDLRVVDKHLTLEQLAEQTGLSKSALGKYETDDYKDISPFAIATLADFYGERQSTEMERETKKSLNIEQIQQIIPHRHPFCLIDRIEDYEPGEFAIGYKAVTYTEEFFKGHFPNKPVMPGVLIVEALAQTGAVAILSTPENKGKIAFFGGIQNCRFKGMVFPGDVLRLETKIIRQKGPVGIGKAVASVDGKVVVSAELTFMAGE